MVSATGLEGSLIYACSAGLRDALAARGELVVTLDLAPDKSPQRVLAEVAHPRGSRSLASHLQSRAGLKGVKLALLHEALGRDGMHDPQRLAATIKALPLTLTAPRPLTEAISSAGGVRFDDLDERLQLRAIPGVYCAGEMLDWEAPTGGYLLTACIASGHAAACGVLAGWKDAVTG
jgi:predicted flavoprotein YhiN